MNKTKLFLLVAFIGVLLIGGAYFIKWNNGHPKDALLLHGNVDIRQVELGFRVGGRIKVMHFEEGDFVPKDALLAELDQTPFLHDLHNQQAQLDQTIANFNKLKTGSRPEEIRQAQSLVGEKEASYFNSQTNVARQQDLIKRGLASQQAYDDATTQMKEYSAQLKSAQEALALSKEGFRVEDIAGAKAALEGSKARLDIAKTNLEDTHLLAPEAGTILTRIKEPGAIVSPGMPVYSLALTQPVWVRAYVSEVDLGRIKPGMPAQIFTDTDPSHPFKGQIGYISPQAEFTPKNIETKELRSDLVYRVRITVQDPKNQLRQGMPVSVKINVAPSS